MSAKPRSAYPQLTISMSKELTNELVADYRAKLVLKAEELGFINSYHKSGGGSIGELIVAIATGKVKMVRVEEISET